MATAPRRDLAVPPRQLHECAEHDGWGRGRHFGELDIDEFADAVKHLPEAFKSMGKAPAAQPAHSADMCAVAIEAFSQLGLHGPNPVLVALARRHEQLLAKFADPSVRCSEIERLVDADGSQVARALLGIGRAWEALSPADRLSRMHTPEAISKLARDLAPCLGARNAELLHALLNTEILGLVPEELGDMLVMQATST
jgi:hypothetical protein